MYRDNCFRKSSHPSEGRQKIWSEWSQLEAPIFLFSRFFFSRKTHFRGLSLVLCYSWLATRPNCTTPTCARRRHSGPLPRDLPSCAWRRTFCEPIKSSRQRFEESSRCVYSAKSSEMPHLYLAGVSHGLTLGRGDGKAGRTQEEDFVRV